MLNIFCVVPTTATFKERYLVDTYFDSGLFSGKYKIVLCELVLINHYKQLSLVTHLDSLFVTSR